MKTLFSVCDLSLKSSRLHKYHDLNICLCAGLEYGRLEENCAGLDLDFGSGLDTFLNVCLFIYRSVKTTKFRCYYCPKTSDHLQDIVKRHETVHTAFTLKSKERVLDESLDYGDFKQKL